MGGGAKMKLGCNTLLFNQIDLYGAMQCISWAGFDGAELASIVPARHLELNTNQSYIDEVKSIAIKQGLELFAIHSEEEGETDAENIKSMAKLCEVARKLNVPIVAPFIRRNPGDIEVTKNNYKYVRKLTEQAENQGITLAIGIHEGTPVENTAMAIQMLNEIDSPALGITLDTREIYKAGEDIAETVSRIGRKIVHVYFRDYPYRHKSGAAPEQEIPGRSQIDFPKTLRYLKKVGYDNAIDVMLKAWTYPILRQMEIAAEGRGYLHRCLQELQLSGNQ
jgi:sugar phosphate isomerase/epimerase